MTQTASYILTSENVFTGKNDYPEKASLAIVDNKIKAIGSKEDLKKYVGPNTRDYDFGDQLIMPGFHDFHVHIMLGCIFQDSLNLIDSRSEAEAAKMVKEFADSRPNDEWILGFSWDRSFWDKGDMPHRKTLDKLIPDRPVFLLTAECHYAWLNSKALEVLNIDQDTPNPPYGEVQKDEGGNPTGILIESAMGLAEEAFNFPKEKKAQLFRSFLDQAAKMGVTSVHDMFPLPGLNLGELDLYREFEENGQLSTRVHFLLELTDKLDEARELREIFTSNTLRFSGLKQFLDGVVTSHTAYLLAPYTNNPNTKGETPFPPDAVKKWVKKADKEKFRIRFHAIGDAAIRLALDSFEEAQLQNGVRDSRHTIEHIEVPNPDDLNRFNTLGVIPSMQPEHLFASEKNTYVSCIGEEREKYTFPIKTLKNTGSNVVFSSDFPVVDLNPFPGIVRAVTRQDSSGFPEKGWNPEQRISLAEALKSYTKHPAYGSFMENELGTLETGKLADIVVLNKNIFACPVEEVENTQIDLTMMNGNIVYKK